MITIPGYSIKEVIFSHASTTLVRAERLSDKQLLIIKIPIASSCDDSVLRAINNEYAIRSCVDSVPSLKIYDQLNVDARILLVFENFDGICLEDYLQQNNPTLSQCLEISLQLVGIVEALHAHDILHRDVRPHNFLINPFTLSIIVCDVSFAQPLDDQRKLSLEHKFVTALEYLSPEQSGRMEMTEDLRSDLYSLGVTFYKIFAGKLPFEQLDMNELVHAHIAKQPVAPHLVNGKLPGVLSDLIVKLLQKKPGDRYQNARSLKFDLKECYHQILYYQDIHPFQLGGYELTAAFKIPASLYGRDEEIKKVVDEFHTIHVQRKFIWLSGSSGIGKSALVQEVHRRLSRENILFLSGKCDQNNQNIPFGVFVAAFGALEKAWKIKELTASDFDITKALVAKAVGSSGKILLDVIPGLEFILGEGSELPALPPVEAQKRFAVTFLNFIEAIASPSRRLILFFDDLQWADSASINFLRLLIESKEARNILIIGAYRDAEIHENPQLSTVISKERDAPLHIHLTPLTLEHISELLADTLGSSASRTRPLADHLLTATLGNPLYVRESITKLHADALFIFNNVHYRWDWSLEEIAKHASIASALQLITEKIQRLPKTTQQTLIYAACIGQQFELPMLAALLDKTNHEVADELREASCENLLKIIRRTPSDDGSHVRSSTTYMFFHDVVQQAACTLIDMRERQEIHLNIGYFLLERISPEDVDTRIFEIVNHFNIAIDVIEDPVERKRIAKLNQQAGCKAKRATAYAIAHSYFTVALNLLTKNVWAADYAFSFSLHLNCSEAAYLSFDFETSDALIDLMLQHVTSRFDIIKVHEVKIQSLIVQTKKQEAVDLGLRVLKSLGIKFPSSHSVFNFLLAYGRSKWILRNKRIEALEALPKMQEPDMVLAMRVMQNITAAAYHVVPGIYPLLVLKMVSLSIKHGNTTESSLAYATYGAIVNAVETNNNTCFRLGNVALALLNQFEDVGIRERTYLIFYLLNRLSHEHVHGSLDGLKQGYQRGIALGDIEYAVYTSNAYCMLLCVSGKNLSWIKDEMLRCNTLPPALSASHKTNYNEPLIQVISNLLNESPNPKVLDGAYFNESIGFPKIVETQETSRLFACYVFKMSLCYFLNDFIEGLSNARRAQEYLGKNRGMVLEPLFYFYAALINFAQYSTTSERKYRSEGLSCKRKLKKWADQVPVNYLHRYLLTEAEYLRSLGKHDEALVFYDQAIQRAQENYYPQDEALANERAATCWMERGQKHSAKIYMTSAIDAYKKWGCTLKVKQLENHNVFQRDSVESDSKHYDIHRLPGTSITPSLDLATILKASLALSSEVVFEKLLEKLMKFVIENAGAQSGYFILDWGGNLFIEARQTVTEEKSVKLKIPLHETELVPRTIVEHVFRYKKDVVLHDAQLDNPFSKDPSIVKNKIRSALCIPTLHQGKLVGALYLENNLMSGTFTNDRVELLKLLSGQIAVSIENSILYENLEQKVAERTAEIHVQKEEIQRQKQLVDEKSKFKEQFFANMSHEIRTPMTAIIGMSDLIFDTPLTEKQAEYAKGIKYSSENLLAIINDILDYSKIEAGKFSFVTKPFQIRERITRLSYIVGGMAAEKGITLISEIDPSIPEQIIGDPLRLHQVLLNLVSNAIKFTNKGNVWISIQQIRSNETSVVLSFTVRDTGIGIAEEKLNFIFETFSRIEDEYNSLHTGTGLGLFIAKRLVEEQGGTMTVTSKIKEGTAFTFTLSFERSNRIVVEEEYEQEIILSGTRVLLVEDTLFNQVVAEEILKKIISNPVVIIAENGKIALDLLEQHTVDIILMDIKMPVMDGYTASRQLRLRPELAFVPILAFTSNANPGEAEKCKAAGMNDYITKPIELKKLKDKISRLLTSGSVVKSS